MRNVCAQLTPPAGQLQDSDLASLPAGIQELLRQHEERVRAMRQRKAHLKKKIAAAVKFGDECLGKLKLLQQEDERKAARVAIHAPE